MEDKKLEWSKPELLMLGGVRSVLMTEGGCTTGYSNIDCTVGDAANNICISGSAGTETGT